MNSEERSRAASIWMMLFSVVGFLLLYKQEQPIWPRYGMQIVLFGLIFVVGLLRMPPSPFEGKKSTLGDLLQTYRDSWDALWRHKWILWLFACWGLMHVVGLLAQHPLNAFWDNARNAFLRSEGSLPHRGSFADIDWLRALRSVPFAGYKLWHAGVSVRGDLATFAVAGIVVLIATLWLQKRLKRLAAEQEYATSANWLQTLLLPFAITWIGLAAALEKASIEYYFAMVHSMAKLTVANPLGSGADTTLTTLPISPGVFGGKRSLLLDFLPVMQSLYLVIMGSLLLAGLAGSLKRLKSDEPITLHTFVRDVVKYWKPLVLLYLLFIALECSFSFIPYVRIPFLYDVLIRPYSQWGGMVWNMALPILMLVPFAVVLYGAGVWKAVRLGLWDFFRSAWDGVSFIALGLTLVSIPLFCQDLLSQMIRVWPGFPSYMSIVVVSTALTALRTAFVSVAIWEFYWTIKQRNQIGASAKNS